MPGNEAFQLETTRAIRFRLAAECGAERGVGIFANRHAHAVQNLPLRERRAGVAVDQSALSCSCLVEHKNQGGIVRPDLNDARELAVGTSAVHDHALLAALDLKASLSVGFRRDISHIDKRSIDALNLCIRHRPRRRAGDD